MKHISAKSIFFCNRYVNVIANLQSVFDGKYWHNDPK